MHSVYSDNDIVLFYLPWKETRLTDKKRQIILWEVVVVLKLAVFKLEKCWKSEHELRFYLNQSSGLPKLPCFHKTLKSISVCKSWNYCTSSNYDSHLVIIISKFLSSLVNNLGFYKISEIKNIYSRRCTFSTLTVDSSLPTFKALLPQITRVCCLQSLIFLKLELLLHSATKVTGVSARLSHNELKVIWCNVGQQTFCHKVRSFLWFFTCFLLKRKHDQYEK